MLSNAYDQNLPKTPANHQALTPLSFLERTAAVTPNHTAIVHGTQRISYRDFYDRARRLGSALAMRYVGPGDTVSVMLANTPAMLDFTSRGLDLRNLLYGTTFDLYWDGENGVYARQITTKSLTIQLLGSISCLKGQIPHFSRYAFGR